MEDDCARLAARVTELETRYTLQDDTLQKLSDVLWRQQRQIEALETRVAALERRVASLDSSDLPAPDDEVPPHY